MFLLQIIRVSRETLLLVPSRFIGSKNFPLVSSKVFFECQFLGLGLLRKPHFLTFDNRKRSQKRRSRRNTIVQTSGLVKQTCLLSSLSLPSFSWPTLLFKQMVFAISICLCKLWMFMLTLSRLRFCGDVEAEICRKCSRLFQQEFRRLQSRIRIKRQGFNNITTNFLGFPKTRNTV